MYSVLQVMETIGKMLPASLNSSAVYSDGGGRSTLCLLAIIATIMYMYVHVCMTVCIYVHVHVCMTVCMYVHVKSAQNRVRLRACNSVSTCSAGEILGL